MGTVKAGFLHKLSGFFKNTWKRRYFVLYQDGVFCYYQDSKDKECDGKIHMKTECRRIQVGNSVGEGVKPPKHIEINAMFAVSSPERTWYLYAETESEGREWISALEQARVPLTYGTQNLTGGSTYPPHHGIQSGSPYPPHAVQRPLQSAPTGPGYPPPIGFNPSITQGLPQAAAPPPPYSQGPPQPQATYRQPPPGYAPPPYSQPYAPQQPNYPPPPSYAQHPQQVPGVYPQQAAAPYYPTAPRPPVHYQQQQYYPTQGATYVQGSKPQTVYVQQPPNQQHSGRNRNLMMGAAAGVVGGAAMGYMLGNTVGGFGGHHAGFGHHGGLGSYGGWGSDHSLSSGGSFECDF